MKQPFTPVGLQDKLNELYLLSDVDLFVQAKALATDMSSFMDEHFTLTPSQASYLGDLTDRGTFSLGCQLAAVLNIRGQISMDDIPANPTGRPKQLGSDSEGEIINHDGPIPGLSGNASIHITWMLL